METTCKLVEKRKLSLIVEVEVSILRYDWEDGDVTYSVVDKEGQAIRDEDTYHIPRDHEIKKWLEEATPF